MDGKWHAGIKNGMYGWEMAHRDKKQHAWMENRTQGQKMACIDGKQHTGIKNGLHGWETAPRHKKQHAWMGDSMQE